MRILLRSLPIHIWWCQFRVKMNIEIVTYHWKWFHLVYFIHYNLLSGVKPSILTSNQNSYCRHFLSLPTTFFYYFILFLIPFHIGPIFILVKRWHHPIDFVGGGMIPFYCCTCLNLSLLVHLGSHIPPYFHYLPLTNQLIFLSFPGSCWCASPSCCWLFWCAMIWYQVYQMRPIWAW